MARYNDKAPMQRKYQAKKATRGGGYGGAMYRKGDKAYGKGTSHTTSSGKSIKWY